VQRAEPIDPEDHADANVAALRSACATGSGATLTLATVRLTPPSGTAVDLPTCRVVLDAVDAWWFAGARPVPEKTAWSFGIGLISPIGQ
jgi:hypothetical protein